MRLRRSTLFFVLGLALLAGTSTRASAANQPQTASTPDASAWAALAKLPDWGGIWIPNQPDQNRQMRNNPPPWTPGAAAQITAEMAQEKAGHPLGLFLNCLPEGMPSWMLISHNAMEILFTPGRVTMLGESDGDRLRRIYTDGRPHPADPDPSFFGDSIGHWDGDTLVVDTVGVYPEGLLAISESIGLPNNGDLHVVERIHLADPNLLYDELEITAPRILTRPWRTTRIFNRQRGPQSDITEGVCLEGNYSESVDAKGNAVFVPAQQVEGNLRVQ